MKKPRKKKEPEKTTVSNNHKLINFRVSFNFN